MMRSLAAALGAAGYWAFALSAIAQSGEKQASPGESFLRAADMRVNLGAVQDEAPPEEIAAGGNQWRVDLITWIWLVGMDGDVGARGRTVDASASFGDILEASDSIFALSGRLEVGYGKWGGFIDGMYSNLGIEDASGPLGFTDVDVTFEMILIDFGVMYRIGEWEAKGDAASNPRNTTLDLYAGGRYTNLDLELDPETLATREDDVEWLDPIVGAKLVLPVAERWHLMGSGDVGGFGVESDFTWSATGVVGYDFTLFDHPASAYFGYRAIGQDFSEGSGNREFTWDVIQHGPLLGFSLQF